MTDPYDNVQKDIKNAFTLYSKMILWIAQRTLSAKDYKEFLDEFAKKVEEQRIDYNKLIHPNMKAIEKRDAFLSDENGKKLQEAIDQIHLMEEVLN